MSRGVSRGFAVAPDRADFGDLLALIPCLGDADALDRFLRGLPTPVVRRILDEWFWKAHGGQEEPKGDWRVWLLMAGRGFGKTRCGAEWVWARTRETERARIALVGATLADVERVMIAGESGLAATARTGEWGQYVASRGQVLFSNGAVATAFSAEAAEKLRGPEHHFAWCDELGKWREGAAAWDNLQLSMRLGERPRTIVTTTPRPVAALKALVGAGGDVAVSRGATRENPHLPASFVDAVTGLYAGTRFGRQELEGEMIAEAEGSLWPRWLIEASRQSGTLPREEFRRVVVGVDPPASASGTCGIVVCGMRKLEGERTGPSTSLRTGYVLADASVSGVSPEGWARAVARAARAWRADRVVAEKNQGGEMVSSVLKAVDDGLPVELVSASVGKAARAEPVAVRFETGRAFFAGRFPELEDELSGLTMGGDYVGPGTSPDRADAMVWAMSELLLAPARAEPRIRSF